MDLAGTGSLSAPNTMVFSLAGVQRGGREMVTGRIPASPRRKCPPRRSPPPALPPWLSPKGAGSGAAEHGTRCYRRRNQHQFLGVRGLCFIHPLAILLKIKKEKNPTTKFNGGALLSKWKIWGFFCPSSQLTVLTEELPRLTPTFWGNKPFFQNIPPPRSHSAANDVLPNSISTATSGLFPIKSF